MLFLFLICIYSADIRIVIINPSFYYIYVFTVFLHAYITY